MADNEEQRATIVGTYILGLAKLYAGCRWYHVNFVTVAGSGSLCSDLYWLGVDYRAAPVLTLTGTAYYQRLENSNAGDLWLFIVGTDYVLSKHTNAYFSLAHAKNSSGSGLDVLNLSTIDSYADMTLGSTNFGNRNVYSSPAIDNINQFGVTVGIRHEP